MPPFILASTSPRRKQLLEQVHYSFTIHSSTVEEKINQMAAPGKVVEELAMLKARDVFEVNREAVVLGADTIVTFNNKILGKPENESAARAMLQLLSGQVHSVYTGVVIISKDKIIVFNDKTDVEFYTLTDEDIQMYIESGESFDKAGGYGIQGLGAYFVKRIEGDYFNVVGLPIARTMRHLQEYGIIPRLKK